MCREPDDRDDRGGVPPSWMDWRYLNCHVSPADLADAVRGARQCAGGVQLLHPAQGRRHSASRRFGRIGVDHGSRQLRRPPGRQIHRRKHGWQGFVLSLQQTSTRAESAGDVSGRRAARAVGVEVALAGARHIYRRQSRCDRGQALPSYWRQKPPPPRRSPAGMATTDSPDADIVVNATSIGLFPTSTHASRSISQRCAQAWSWRMSSPIHPKQGCSKTRRPAVPRDRWTWDADQPGRDRDQALVGCARTRW